MRGMIMQFQTYLTETVRGVSIDSTDDNIQKILDETKKWRKLLGRGELYRRMHELPDFSRITQLRTPKNRKPIGTEDDTFRAFNAWAQSAGVPRRDRSVSTSVRPFGSYDRNHPLTMIFLPKGDFKYAWVRSYDFNEDDSDSGWGGYDTPNYVWGDEDSIYIEKDTYLGRQLKLSPYVDDENVIQYPSDGIQILGGAPEEVHNMVKDTIKTKMIIANKGIKTAINPKNRFEVWIECNNYYLIPVKIYDEYMK